MEVATTATSEVATATRMSKPNPNTSTGTMISPPPIPTIEPSHPAKTPSSDIAVIASSDSSIPGQLASAGNVHTGCAVVMRTRSPAA